MRFHFGEFILDTRTGELLGPEGPVVLRRQTWRLLLELLDSAPALTDRETLLDRVWGRTAVAPNVLPQTLSELRQLLGDSARSPSYIETVHGRGYRLICEVRREAADSSVSPLVGWRHLLTPSRAVLTLVAMAIVMVIALQLISLGNGKIGAPSLSHPAADRGGSGAQAQAMREQAEQARRNHDPETAAAHWRALSVLYPNDIEVLLQLAAAELDGLQGRQARSTLSRLSSLDAAAAQPRWHLLKARLALIEGEFGAALAHARQAQQLAQGEDDKVVLLETALQLAYVHQRRGDLKEALKGLAAIEHNGELGPAATARLQLQQLRMAREAGDLASAELIRQRLDWSSLVSPWDQHAHIEAALIDAERGQAERARQQLVELETLPDALEEPDLAIAVLNARGVVAVELGEVEQAAGLFERAFELARQTGRAYRVAALQVNAGSLMARADRFEEADRLWSDALAVFEDIGDRRGMAICLGNLAAAASARGHNERSRLLNQRALQLFRELDLPSDRARTAFNLALLTSREGGLAETEELLAEAQGVYLELGQHELLLHVGAFRGEHLIMAGNLAAATALLDELEAFKTHGSPLRQSALYAARGRLALWQGDLEQARSWFQNALALRRQGGQEVWIATSELELLRLDLLAGGDPWRIRVRAEALAGLFASRNQVRASARARLLAAEALLSQGAVDDARSLLARVKSDHEQFPDHALALELAWVETWAGREEERLPRLEALARRAIEKGYFGKVTLIEAGARINGLDLSLDEALAAGLMHGQHSGTLLATLPPYARAQPR
jgi:DNA-binding winged helix-turn-helix (wHTH) protein/tetratricopeptide (TPR) repeat protein